MQVKRTAINCYTVDTGERVDACMILDGNVLRSWEHPSFIRSGGLLKLNLGPVSLAKLTALQIGETVTL